MDFLKTLEDDVNNLVQEKQQVQSSNNEIKEETSIKPNKKFIDLSINELNDLSKNVLDILVDALQDTHGTIREMAASALGELGDLRALEQLKNATKDPNAEVRRNSAGALGKLKSIEAIPCLGEALNDENQDVRYWTVEALAQFQEPEAVKYMIDIFLESDEFVSSIANDALAKLTDPRVIPVLKEHIKNPKISLRTMITEVLGKIGTEEAEIGRASCRERV